MEDKNFLEAVVRLVLEHFKKNGDNAQSKQATSLLEDLASFTSEANPVLEVPAPAAPADKPAEKTLEASPKTGK